MFDTWFTSTLLPIAVFGWPSQKIKSNHLPFDKIYPTNLLETGFDIMFFWAFRMVIDQITYLQNILMFICLIFKVAMCHTLTGKLPYSQILFHGLIKDSQGRKMSKSIGNVIDPMDLINGASLNELKKRIVESNLSEKEKKTSIKNQEKTYPNGIESIGSDATRLSLLIQDFKCKIFTNDLFYNGKFLVCFQI